MIEELVRIYESGFVMSLHRDIVAPYIYSFGIEAQKEKWLPACVSGEAVTAIAMTEPGTGSDVCATEIEVARILDTLMARHAKDEYLVKGWSMAKMWQTEMASRVIERCPYFCGYK